MDDENARVGGVRDILTMDELTRRMGELPPRILVVPEMRDARIVCETATEEDFGPRMRRMAVYAMSPATLHRASNEVRNRWGERQTWDITHSPVVGPLVRVPLRFADGIREWEIVL